MSTLSTFATDSSASEPGGAGASLRATAPAQERFIALDGLRGAAALAVTLFHAKAIFGEILPGAYLAVDLFFAMSGFVIAHGYERKLRTSLSLSEFVRRRVIRLAPLYYAGLALGALHLGSKVVLHPEDLDAASLGLFLALALVFVPVPWAADIFPANIPSWSLFYELVANIAYAAVVRWLTDARLWGLVVLSGSGFAAVALRAGTTGGGPHPEDWEGALLRVAFSFSAGVLAYRYRGRTRLNPLPWIAIAILALAVAVPEAWRVPYNLACIGLLFPALVWLIGSSTVSPAPALMERMGTLSYALYMIHLPMIWLLYPVVSRLPLPLWLSGLGLVGALCLAALMLSLRYDAPARRWLAVRLGAPRTTAAGAGAAQG